MTTLQPRTIGLYRFRGTRCVRVGQYEHINTVLSVVWLAHRKREMAVQMLGKQRYFPLGAFSGEWEQIVLKQEAA